MIKGDCRNRHHSISDHGLLQKLTHSVSDQGWLQKLTHSVSDQGWLQKQTHSVSDHEHHQGACSVFHEADRQVSADTVMAPQYRPVTSFSVSITPVCISSLGTHCHSTTRHHVQLSFNCLHCLAMGPSGHNTHSASNTHSFKPQMGKNLINSRPPPPPPPHTHTHTPFVLVSDRGQWMQWEKQIFCTTAMYTFSPETKERRTLFKLS